jgi:hypothetical protein
MIRMMYAMVEKTAHHIVMRSEYTNDHAQYVTLVGFYGECLENALCSMKVISNHVQIHTMLPRPPLGSETLTSKYKQSI